MFPRHPDNCYLAAILHRERLVAWKQNKKPLRSPYTRVGTKRLDYYFEGLLANVL